MNELIDRARKWAACYPADKYPHPNLDELGEIHTRFGLGFQFECALASQSRRIMEQLVLPLVMQLEQEISDNNNLRDELDRLQKQISRVKRSWSEAVARREQSPSLRCDHDWILVRTGSKSPWSSDTQAQCSKCGRRKISG